MSEKTANRLGLALAVPGFAVGGYYGGPCGAAFGTFVMLGAGLFLVMVVWSVAELARIIKSAL